MDSKVQRWLSQCFYFQGILSFSEQNRSVHNQLNHQISTTIEEWVTYYEDRKVGAIHFMKESKENRWHGWFLQEFDLALMAVENFTREEASGWEQKDIPGRSSQTIRGLMKGAACLLMVSIEQKLRVCVASGMGWNSTKKFI